MRDAIAIVLVGVLGCDDAATTGEMFSMERAEPLPEAGLTPWACQPGELLLDDGSCLPAGIAPEDCPAGFAPTGDRACEPTIVECGPGRMALAGEASCRPVAPCASGTWGDIPVEPNTQYVAAGSSGGDGSAEMPFANVQQAVDNAVDGGIVAIAAGSYAENVTLHGKRLHLWGVCPDLVEIAGALRIDADESEVHTLAVRAPGDAAIQIAARDVLVDRLWVHEAGIIGIDAEYDDPSVKVQGSLIELSNGIGVFGFGADVLVEETVVRDIGAVADGTFGHGIRAYIGASGTAGTLTVRRSIVQRVRGAGIQGVGSPVLVEDSVIRDVTAEPGPSASGYGITVIRLSPSVPPTPLTVSGAYVEDTQFGGIVAINNDATVERSVVREVNPSAEEAEAHGISVYVQHGFSGNQLTARGVVVEGVRGNAISAIEAGAIVESAIVRDTKPYVVPSDEALTGGRGIVIERYSHETHRLEVRGSRVERTHDLGIAALGHDMVVESTLVSDVAARATDGAMGRGITIQPELIHDATVQVTVRDSLVEDAHECGICVTAATADIESTWIRNTLPSLSGAFARGINLQGDFSGTPPGEGTIRHVLVEDTAGIGVLVAAAHARIEYSIVRGTYPGHDGLFGDGVAAIPFEDFTKIHAASAELAHSILSDNERAGVAAFGAAFSLEALRFECNVIDLNGTPFLDEPYAFEDVGGNECGCGGSQRTCKVTSSDLRAPEPLPP